MVVVLIALPLAIFWTWQFVQLMLLEDRFFPGRLDKLLWGAAFVLVVPLAPFAFRAWKFARTAEQSSASPAPGSPL